MFQPIRFPNPDVQHPGIVNVNCPIPPSPPGLPLWEALRRASDEYFGVRWVLDVIDEDHAKLTKVDEALVFNLSIDRTRKDCPYLTRVELPIDDPKIAGRVHEIVLEYQPDIQKSVNVRIGFSHDLDFKDELAIPNFRISTATRWLEVPHSKDEHRVADYVLWKVTVLLWLKEHGTDWPGFRRFINVT